MTESWGRRGGLRLQVEMRCLFVLPAAMDYINPNVTTVFRVRKELRIDKIINVSSGH